MVLFHISMSNYRRLLCYPMKWIRIPWQTFHSNPIFYPSRWSDPRGPRCLRPTPTLALLERRKDCSTCAGACAGEPSNLLKMCSPKLMSLDFMSSPYEWLRNPNHQFLNSWLVPLFIGFQHVSTILLVVQDVATIHSMFNGNFRILKWRYLPLPTIYKAYIVLAYLDPEISIGMWMKMTIDSGFTQL